MKVWHRAGIELTAPRSAVRHVSDWATRPGIICILFANVPVLEFRL